MKTEGNKLFLICIVISLIIHVGILSYWGLVIQPKINEMARVYSEVIIEGLK